MSKQYRKEYYQKNKERLRSRQTEYMKKYREENEEKMKQYQRDYYNKNREKIKEYLRNYQRENRDKINSYHRKYNDKNRETINKYNRRYSAALNEQSRENASNHMKLWTTNEERSLIEMYKNGVTYKEMAETLGRTISSISNRLTRLKRR